jgi:colanic acid biosynthesis glycosyl transferase WcaI
MRCIYLSPYFWPEQIGSAPYSTELATWLREQGYDIRVVAFRPHYPNVNAYTSWAEGSRDEESYANIPIRRVPVRDRGGSGFSDRLKNDISFLWHVCMRALRGEFKGANVVLAYTPTILTLYAARLIRFLTGASIVCVVHDIESGLAASLGLAKNRVLLFVMRSVEKIGLNFAGQVVVLTEGMASELRQIGCRRDITVLPIWATVSDFVPVERSQVPVVMYSGNFGKKQNLDQLIPLMKRLSDEKSPIMIHMRGDGSERERIENKIKGLGILNVRFMPLASANDFLQVLQSTNVHLVPQASNVSNYALPSKLFSIMSAGRPFICIATEGSPLDLLTQQSRAGLCVRPGDEEELYQAIIKLTGNPDIQEEMGKNGQSFVDQNMNKENIMNSYRNLMSKD